MNKTRPKQLSFRVSEEEYQQLQEKISESGKNQQEYILSCVLEKQIVNTDGIKELIPELKRIGNNLNQIAKRCSFFLFWIKLNFHMDYNLYKNKAICF